MIRRLYYVSKRMWGRTIKKRLLLPTLLLAALVCGSASSAHASDDPSGFDVDPARELQVLADADGNLYTEIQVKGTQFGVASWERENGVWNSPQEILDDLQGFSNCVLNYAKTYKSLDEFKNALTGSAQSASGAISLDQVFATSKMLSCFQGSEYMMYALKNRALIGGSVNTVRRILLDKFGPGVHELFIQNIASTQSDSGLCEQVTFELGDTLSACNPKLGGLDRIKVRIAEPSNEVALMAQELKDQDPGKWFKKSTYLKLKPIDFSSFQNFGKMLGPAATVAGVAVIFSVLIALPTTLIESSMEAHQDRVEALVRKIVPSRFRRKRKLDDEGKDVNENE